jgi:hypothetical protein
VRGHFCAFSSAFLTLTTLAWLPAAGRAQPVRPALLVMLQNDANVEADFAGKAQAEVTRLFALIDIEISWVTEVPPAGTRLRVVSLTMWEPSDRKVPASVLGYTQVAPGKRGTRAYVFWNRVERASLSFTASLDKVLAVAIAHELGHMLLPDGKHAKSGLMAAPWDPSHFRSASAGLLLFSEVSAELIRGELERADTLTTSAASSVGR